MQGLGTGPAGVLAGCKDGRLYVVTRQERCRYLRCLLEAPPSPDAKMECVAASDEVVVTGSSDGGMRVVRMDTPSRKNPRTASSSLMSRHCVIMSDIPALRHLMGECGLSAYIPLESRALTTVSCYWVGFGIVGCAHEYRLTEVLRHRLSDWAILH
jgi:hypothetical protein